MGVLISQTLSEIHFHNSIVVNAKIKFSKHLEHSLEIFKENIKYLHVSLKLKIGFFEFPVKIVNLFL